MIEFMCVHSYGLANAISLLLCLGILLFSVSASVVLNLKSVSNKLKRETVSCLYDVLTAFILFSITGIVVSPLGMLAILVIVGCIALPACLLVYTPEKIASKIDSFLEKDK